MPKENSSSDHFGGKDKNRGRDHWKDKTKYKAKSVNEPKYAQRKSKPNLGSNWDRYEKQDVTESPRLTSSTDFSILANAPIVQGQHFQFKHDKIIAEEIDKTSNELFSLDLNMLKHSVLTIPFYKRVGIENGYFTANQTSFMDRNAHESIVRYNEKYNSDKILDEQIVEPCLKINSDLVDQKEYGETKTTEEVTKLVTESEDLRRLEIETKTERTEEDLEQWLEDILDE